MTTETDQREPTLPEGGKMHPRWRQLVALIDRIADRWGGGIYDRRCGKTWDPGQAVCAEFYGPHWQDDPQFLADDQATLESPPPEGIIAAAERLLVGECEWAVFSPGGAAWSYAARRRRNAAIGSSRASGGGEAVHLSR